jgi:hypothetical protein
MAILKMNGCDDDGHGHGCDCGCEIAEVVFHWMAWLRLLLLVTLAMLLML